jgi:hypothetical protein
VLPLALGVGKPKIDVFDLVFLDGFQDFMRGIGHGFLSFQFWEDGPPAARMKGFFPDRADSGKGEEFTAAVTALCPAHRTALQIWPH